MPWVGIKDATQNHGRTLDTTLQSVSELGLQNSSARLLPTDTVCLSRTASVGYVVKMGCPMATSQDFVNWVCGKNLDPDFLKYVLLAEGRDLLRFASGTTHQTIYYPEAKAFHVLMPPLPEQRRIAEILGALDDKIELNLRMNQTLEDMAQAIFQNALAGCDPIEGQMPPDWTLKTLGEAAKESGGVVQTGPFGSQLHASDYVQQGIPSVMPKDLKADRISTLDVARVREADAERLAKHRLVPGDVIYSRRGDVERRALVLEREAGWLCGTGCLRVRLGAAAYNAHFLYQYLGLPAIRAWIVRHAQGATMPNLNTKILGSLPFGAPSHEEQERIGERVGSLHLKREANFSESETLAQLRDTLLPKLISGEIRGRDAERVEAVA